MLTGITVAGITNVPGTNVMTCITVVPGTNGMTCMTVVPGTSVGARDAGQTVSGLRASMIVRFLE